MEKISTEALAFWRARLDHIESEIHRVVKDANASSVEGPLAERLRHLHELKEATDREVQSISERLIAARFDKS